MEFPRLIRVRQKLNDERIDDIEGVVYRELMQHEIVSRVNPGARVAVAVGSRGISCLDRMVRTIVHWVRERGAQPFIVPAMGSHGNASAEGQADLLRGYGIYEEAVGAPVLSSMEVDLLGKTPQGAPVYIDRYAHTADAIILVNRVKPHTTVKGPVQSGLLKMMTVGLGKQKGAEAMHRYRLEIAIPEAARIVMARAPIAFGLAVVENAFDQPALIRAIPRERIEKEERDLLRKAEANLPVIPFDPLDVLIVDWMGKNISGSGMDTNVVGLWRRIGGPVDRVIHRIAVLDLTEESHGNAAGVGMADVITRRLYQKIDLQATYMNCITAGYLPGAKIPITLDTDREVIGTALVGYQPESVRLVRIESTLRLDRFFISEGLLPEASAHPRIEILGEPEEMRFGGDGRILNQLA